MQAQVYNRHNVGQSHGRLRDVCGEHDVRGAGVRLLEDHLLLFSGDHGVQRVHLVPVVVLQCFGLLPERGDLRNAWQEDQDRRAGFSDGTNKVRDDGCHLLAMPLVDALNFVLGEGVFYPLVDELLAVDPPAELLVEVLKIQLLHRKAPPADMNALGYCPVAVQLPEVLRENISLQGGGHDHDADGAVSTLEQQLHHQAKHVALGTPLVHLIEHHMRVPGELLRSVHQQLQKVPRGAVVDVLAGFALAADSVADVLPQSVVALPEFKGDPLGQRQRCHATRLRHNDARGLLPRCSLLEDQLWDLRALPATSLAHDAADPAAAARQLLDDLLGPLAHRQPRALLNMPLPLGLGGLLLFLLLLLLLVRLLSSVRRLLVHTTVRSPRCSGYRRLPPLPPPGRGRQRLQVPGVLELVAEDAVGVRGALGALGLELVGVGVDVHDFGILVALGAVSAEVRGPRAQFTGPLVAVHGLILGAAVDIGVADRVMPLVHLIAHIVPVPLQPPCRHRRRHRRPRRRPRRRRRHARRAGGAEGCARPAPGRRSVGRGPRHGFRRRSQARRFRRGGHRPPVATRPRRRRGRSRGGVYRSRRRRRATTSG
mmetsp:Transcript_681/g.2614  ORF Transcript_681/g.2614 Transcript_681/m.2614 type:complete len:597 (+) Transcript_681:1730-3520(+)